MRRRSTNGLARDRRVARLACRRPSSRTTRRPHLLVLQPESTIDPTAQQAFDTVARNGGTLVVAGDSFPWLLYARELGVTVSTARTQTDCALNSR